MYNLKNFVSILYISKESIYIIFIFSKLICIIRNFNYSIKKRLSVKAYVYISEVVSFLESFGLID